MIATKLFKQLILVSTMFGIRVTLKIFILLRCVSSHSASLENKKQHVFHENASIMDLNFFGLEVATSLRQ